MSKPTLAVALVFLIAPACDPNSSNPWFRPPSGQQGCQGSQQSYEAQNGKVVSAVTAHDLDENREVTNTETYPVFDHGFALDLPFGHYDIEITDETNAMLARYPDVAVDGEVTLDASSVAQR